MNTIKIIIYSTPTKKEPFKEWFDGLDTKSQAIIITRLDRVELGNYGDCKQLKNGEGVFELRIDYGPGYRVYFGKEGKIVVILLVGGDKGSQSRDIDKAKRYWLDYKESLHD